MEGEEQGARSLAPELLGVVTGDFQPRQSWAFSAARPACGQKPTHRSANPLEPPVYFAITQFVRLVSVILQVRNERFIPQEAGLAASTVCKPLRAASAFQQVFPSCLSPPLGGVAWDFFKKKDLMVLNGDLLLTACSWHAS